MMACSRTLADDFLIKVGFTIEPSPAGHARTAKHPDGRCFNDIEPACTCCPQLAAPRPVSSSTTN
ncbi:hypothetical protein K1W54_04810 [Micromonospora sp. CPCC 205371]|nr:hypothetical protein [Micromonospora sp. CPCC 205371]